MANATILVVEDESIIALDIRSSLLNSGYQVAAIATSATEALAKVAEVHPDLVLMDIRIKGDMDGVDTAERIHREFSIPVVYLTAHADENTLQRAKLTAPFGYVLKPFEDRELITTIEIALHRHQAEVAIRNALERERELGDLKSQFVALVSHEFRNPLSTILFSAELLERYSEQLTAEKKQIYFQRIQSSVKRMNYLLSEVLTLGEVESGKLQFNPQPLDLLSFCRELIEEMQPEVVATHQICLNYHTASSLQEFPSHLILDEKLLRHILTNLLSNAIKYSPQGGSIEFDLTCKPGEIIFQIQDHGIGIPVADREDLFNSFYRAKNVNTIPGTGLGLPIVKQCVEMHGGKVFFTSELGLGTTFTVVLPSHYS
jgi:signal transduction histidine kinase